MANILATKLRPEARSVKQEDERGVVREVEDVVHLVESVTFQDVLGAVHTLTFHPEGTNVAGEAESNPRIVGKDVPYHEFLDAAEAVEAFLDGKL
jgi:hypothetical protein